MTDPLSAAVSVEAVSFQTRGVRTAATLTLPAQATKAAPVPAVVTGPGFGGVKEILIPHYAHALAAAGIACLAFDPVGFGDSAGERRQHIDPREQLASFGTGLGLLGADPRIDSARLGVFGTSLAGAHAINCAASDPRVRCAVVIVPFIALRERPELSIVALSTTELFRRALRRPDRYIAVAGAPGTRAAMTTDGAEAWFAELAKDAPNFRNAVTVSSLINMPRYSSRKAAGNLTVPTLAIVAEQDTITPGALVRDALAGSPQAKVIGFPETHFELFTTHLGETVDATTEWFVEHLASAG